MNYFFIYIFQWGLANNLQPPQSNAFRHMYGGHRALSFVEQATEYTVVPHLYDYTPASFRFLVVSRALNTGADPQHSSNDSLTVTE